MRITTLLVVCMCCLVAAPAVWGQAPNTSAKPGILGYLDPQTGSFRPVPQMTGEDVASAAATTIYRDNKYHAHHHPQDHRPH